MPRVIAILLALLLAGGSLAQSVLNVNTFDDPDSRLELRNYVLPDGTEVTFYVLYGNPVVVTMDDQELRANHVEVDFERRELRIVGQGSFFNGSETVEGSDLVIDITAESFTGHDVLVITSAMDVTGTSAYRVPGQISFTEGYFSPCTRCGQEVDDFGFRAGRLELFPGDRLVAFEVTLQIRGRQVMYLPFLVVPLARQDRQPRLSFIQGTETERARIELDWPYVWGPQAYGTFSVRYHADVDTSAGGLPGRLLGGSVDVSYLGGGVDHRFHTDAGAGRFTLMYVPSFLDAEHEDGRTPALLAYRFEYASAQEATEPGTMDSEVLIERDDERRMGMIEYHARLTHVDEHISTLVRSQGFFDLHRFDDELDPSWWSRRTPRRTLFQIQVRPRSATQIELGVLRLSNLLLELGVFEDATNPALRAITTSTLMQAGRVHASHRIELPALRMWSGFELTGTSTFSGWYYSGGQRLIDWSSRVGAKQQLGELGSLNLSFTRDVTEGETPFRFDQLPLRERSHADADLRFVPFTWVNLTARTGFVFTDSRNPRAEGWQTLDTTLTLFADRQWISLVFSNERDLKTGDPGNLETELTLRASDRDASASVTATYTHDLDKDFAEDGAEPVNETATRLSATVQRENLRVELDWGYNFEPEAQDEADEPLRYWEPFNLGVTLGSMRANDEKAGFRLQWTRDMNHDRPDAFQVEGRFMTGPLEVSLMQRFRLPEGGIERSSLSVGYPNYFVFEATGVVLVRPEWVWLEPGGDHARNITLSLADNPERGPQLWQIRYATTLDPKMNTLGGSIGGRRNTSLELRALLEEETVGDNSFSVDFFLDVPLADDQLAGTYLRRANLTLGVDFQRRVGLQGTLGYRGTWSPAQEEVTRGDLTLDNVALTVRVLDDLYVGAVLNDVWNLQGESTTRARFNLQPEFMVMWNRCCWALYGSWNSATGQIRVSLTTPGAETGLTEEFESPLLLPNRHENIHGSGE